MSKIPQELEPILHRQRRFCILMSLTIIAYYTLGINVKSEAQYSGFVLILQYPNNVIYGLWIIWGWALLRYFQRIYELLSVIWEEVIEDVYAEDLRIATSYAKKFGNELAKKGKLNGLPENARIRGKAKIEQLKTEDTFYQETGHRETSWSDYIITKNKSREYPNISATFDWNDGQEHGSIFISYTMEITQIQIILLRIRAWFHALIRLPAITEYIAPFIIAFIALVVAFIEPCIYGQL